MPLTVLPCKLWGVIGCTLKPAGIDLLSGTKPCCYWGGVGWKERERKKHQTNHGHCNSGL